MEKYTILVLEPDPEARLLLEEGLRAEGFEVVAFESFAEAVRAADESVPDLIVAAFIRPLVIGEGVISRLRRQEGSKQIPIIALVEFSRLFGNIAFAAGATAVLERPPDVPRLMETIKRLLGSDGT